MSFCGMILVMHLKRPCAGQGTCDLFCHLNHALETFGRCIAIAMEALLPTACSLLPRKHLSTFSDYQVGDHVHARIETGAARLQNENTAYLYLFLDLDYGYSSASQVDYNTNR